MIMSRQLRRISIIFMLIVSIQILCGLNATVEAAQSHSIYDIQEKLTEKGYDPGPMDGIMGLKTSEALKKFQKANDLPVSAKLDIETKKKLFEESVGKPDQTEERAISSESATTMTHTAPDFFVADQRIQLQAEVEDPAGIKLVRCYFKAAGEADMVFVPMNLTGKDEYTAVLPAPSTATTHMEYLFLAVNDSKQVVRSQNFAITKDENQKTPAWQEVPKDGEIKVSMEMDQVPSELQGFNDNVTIDTVESSARFGLVALIYHNAASSVAVSSASASTGATSAGTVTAGGAGWSTATIVGVGLGAAAAVGGTIAATSGGGGGGSNNNNDVVADDSLNVTEDNIIGTWSYDTNSSAYSTVPEGLSNYISSISQTWTFNEDGSYIINATVNYTDQIQDQFPDLDLFNTTTVPGTWSLSGNNINLNTNANDGNVYSGSIPISNISGSSGSVTGFTVGSGQGQIIFKRL